MVSNYGNSYVYKKEVDWSLLMEGLTLKVEHQVVFGQIIDRFLVPGENKPIKLVLNGRSYSAKVVNVNFNTKYRNQHKSDVVQIRYTKNGDLSKALQTMFYQTYNYLKAKREMRAKGDRRMILVPEEDREYLAIYTTEYDDTYLIEAITKEDLSFTKEIVSNIGEQKSEYEFETIDSSSNLISDLRMVKIRKLNRLIGENLKQLYSYRCQICGKPIGEEYGTHVADAHHIEYFIKSLNNDASNQMILCPNHHRIIHSADPHFDRSKLAYLFDNGMETKLTLNIHLK